MKKIYLWPACLAVIYTASILIIVSPIRHETIIKMPPTPTPSKYQCPKSDWVDCMPGPGPVKAECGQEYLDWAQKNCPDFKGAAL